MRPLHHDHDGFFFHHAVFQAKADHFVLENLLQAGVGVAVDRGKWVFRRICVQNRQKVEKGSLDIGVSRGCKLQCRWFPCFP